MVVEPIINLPADNDPRNDNGSSSTSTAGAANHAFSCRSDHTRGPRLGARRAGVISRYSSSSSPTPDFKAAARATVAVAGELFGKNGVEQRTVTAAWRVVGVL